MTYSRTQFEIQNLRALSQQRVMESILMLLAALFISALLPSLLLRYFYDTATLLQEPAALQYIPVVSFIVGVGYLLFALLGNLSRGRKIRQLQLELTDMSAECACGSEAEISDQELAELEKMVDEVLESKEAQAPKKPARKKTSKRSTAAKAKATK